MGNINKAIDLAEETILIAKVLNKDMIVQGLQKLIKQCQNVK